MERLKKLVAAAEKVEFIKQVPVHPKNRLKKSTKEQEKHPRGRMKNMEGQIARDNVSKLMRGEFDFNPKKILNKTLLFDTKKINEEITMDRIVEALPPTNDEFNIEHPIGSNAFSLKRED